MKREIIKIVFKHFHIIFHLISNIENKLPKLLFRLRCLLLISCCYKIKYTRNEACLLLNNKLILLMQHACCYTVEYAVNTARLSLFNRIYWKCSRLVGTQYNILEMQHACCYTIEYT